MGERRSSELERYRSSGGVRCRGDEESSRGRDGTSGGKKRKEGKKKRGRVGGVRASWVQPANFQRVAQCHVTIF